MRMGQHHRIDLRGVVRERDAIAYRLMGTSLEHAAIDQHLRARCGEEELRARDGRRRSKELQFHLWLFCGAMFGPVLRGQHVTLRPADDSDPPRMVPWFADMEVTRYLGRRMAVALYYEVEILKRFGEADDTVFWMIEAHGET